MGIIGSMPKNKIKQIDYCQFLLASQINYTQTYFGEHSAEWSHDQINRYLRGEHITPRQVWENVRGDLILSENGYLVFDDTVADKRHSFQIEPVRRQWSGNAQAVIKGIGIVTCVYVNPAENTFWIIDYRVYDPERDGKTKIDHLLEMLRNIHYQKKLPFRTVLMDSWYATRKVMRFIEKLEKFYYCPIKRNRKVDATDGQQTHQRVEHLSWDATETKHGKLIHLKDFPKGHRVKLFRLVLSTQRTDYIVTNDLDQDSAQAAQEQRSLCWKIEQFHREAKQITGIEKCQCQKQRAQRNHIGCSILVWVQLKRLAQQSGKTIYQLKFGLLSDYMRSQLKQPSIRMSLA